MQTANAFPSFIKGPLYNKVYRYRLDTTDCAGSCFYVAVSKSHFNAYTYASKQVVIEHPPQQYKLAPNTNLNSDIFRCIVPFGGKALSSGGATVAASDFNLPFTGTFTGQKVDIDPDSATTAATFRYYEGATLNSVSASNRCYPSPTTGITNNRVYFDLSSTASPAAVYGDYDVGSTEMVFFQAQHIQQAKLVNYTTPGVQGPYQMYFGFMPNDVSNQTVSVGDPNDWWGFVYNLAVTSWSAPSSATGTHNTCNIVFTPNGANTYAAATDRYIVMGFLKDTAWGKTAANILDSEIMLGGRLDGTTFNFIANGQVIYDPADETLAGAASPYTITGGAGDYVGFGFAAGETTGVGASFANVGALLETTLQGGTHNFRGFRVGDYVTLHPTAGSTLPATVTEGHPYYLKAGTGNYQFYLSATDAGGATVAYAAGVGTFYAKVYGATDGLDHQTAAPTDFNADHSMQILVNLLNGGTSTTSARQRFLRADVNFASTFYAVVTDLVTAGSAYVESITGANVDSMYLDTMYGVSYDLPDGFWQDETNCVEDVYGGQT